MEDKSFIGIISGRNDFEKLLSRFIPKNMTVSVLKYETKDKSAVWTITGPVSLSAAYTFKGESNNDKHGTT